MVEGCPRNHWTSSLRYTVCNSVLRSHPLCPRLGRLTVDADFEFAGDVLGGPVMVALV
jgi:hypothetical protein